MIAIETLNWEGNHDGHLFRSLFFSGILYRNEGFSVEFKYHSFGKYIRFFGVYSI